MIQPVHHRNDSMTLGTLTSDLLVRLPTMTEEERYLGLEIYRQLSRGEPVSTRGRAQGHGEFLPLHLLLPRSSTRGDMDGTPSGYNGNRLSGCVRIGSPNGRDAVGKLGQPSARYSLAAVLNRSLFPSGSVTVIS